MVVGSLIAIALVAAVRPLTDIRAARAADRGLGTDDAFGAAIEFADLDSDFGEGIRQRAAILAKAASAKAAAPLPRLRGRWAIAAALAAAALVMGLVANPQDEVRAERAQANEVAEELAQELEEAAAELDDPDTVEVGAQLDRLAEELRQAQSFDEISELLNRAEQELSERSPNFATERAAAEGLERSLETNPLARAGCWRVGGSISFAVPPPGSRLSTQSSSGNWPTGSSRSPNPRRPVILTRRRR